MSVPLEPRWTVADTETLRATLEGALCDHVGAARCIVSLERRPSAYRTSFALEELDVGLDDGSTLRLMYKDLGWGALHEAARQAKPTFLYDARREIETYRTILAPWGHGTAVCYGAIIDERSGRYWLFLERVPGTELYQVGDFGTWRRVAHWLAGLHARFAGTPELAAVAQTAHLIDHDEHFYRAWMRRARAFRADASPRSPSDHARYAIERLASRYERVVARLTALPRTLVHGEFFASNVLVEETPWGLRVCPVDWEMAGIGPGLIDLAALIAGNWTEEEKQALALSYRAALPPELRWPTEDSFLAALDYCQLHLAVQWLGWSSEWSPPVEHARDWPGEALHLANKLGL